MAKYSLISRTTAAQDGGEDKTTTIKQTHKKRVSFDDSMAVSKKKDDGLEEDKSETYQRDYIFPNQPKKQNENTTSEKSTYLVPLDDDISLFETEEKNQIQSLSNNTDDDNHKVESLLGKIDNEEDRGRKISYDRLLRLQNELRRSANVSCEKSRIDITELKQRLHDHHEAMRAKTSALSPVAKILYEVRRENSSRARALFHKMSTKSFLYTMLVRHYIFRHDISKEDMTRIYEELQESANRTDAMQLQMNNHRNDLINQPRAGKYNVEFVSKNLLRNGLKCIKVGNSEQEEEELLHRSKKAENDPEEKDKDNEEGEDVGLKKSISEIVEESIEKLEYVLKMVRRTG